jgi:alkanesulfonate monooxygenase SsuD/methylene tetrahydromethanopterin reductase-like flavin-dependent oxidoreductase (luciferase family)
MNHAIGVPNVGPFGDVTVLVDLARRAEAAGWDGWFVWDHLLYHHADWPVVDPWVALSAAAALTRRIRLGVLLAVVARYRPWRLAKTAATIDRLSGGRLVFGAGLGSIATEYEAFAENSDARARADRLDEGLALIQRFWQGEAVRHTGTHYRVDAPALLPTPVQPHIPIWVGGRWPARRPFRRAARWNGVMPTHADYPHGTTIPAEQLARIIDYVMSQRTSQDPFDIVVEGESPPDGHDAHAAADLVAAYAEIGVTWWVEKLGWWRGGLDAAIERIDAGPPHPAR